MRQVLQFLKRYYICFCWLGLSTVAAAFPSVTKIGDTTVSSAAMTLDSSAQYGYSINGVSFQQEVLWTFNGWQYITYYNASRHVCVGRRQLPSGSWQVIELTDYTVVTTSDAHNVVAMGICPNDGTIHLSFDNHHGGSPGLDYGVSQAGVVTNPESITWSASLFGSVRNYLISGQAITSVTYPAFWPTPDGNLQFGYRRGSSGNGDWYIADYSAVTGLWSNDHQVINRSGTYSGSNSRCAYMNNMLYGPDGKLQFTWTWREGAGTANHDIMYAYSKDGGNVWYNGNPGGSLRIGTAHDPLQSILRFSWLSQGLEIVGQTSPQLLINLNSSGINAVTLDGSYGLMNQQAEAIDSQGRVHAVMFHCTPESYVGYTNSTWGPIGARRYSHYWRDSGNVWHRNELPFNSGDAHSYVGSRPKLFIRSNGDAYVIYQSWQSVSLTSTSIYINSGDLVIQAATAANQWNDWQIIHNETGPFLNEMLGDRYRFEDGVLSVMVQNTPSATGASSSLRVLDFQLNN